MKRRLFLHSLALCAALSTACAGDIMSVDGDGDDDDVVEPATLTITSPAPGSVHARDDKSGFGALVALVDVTAETSGPIVRVVFEDGDGGQLAELVGDELSADVEFPALGDQTVTARGYDADDRLLISETVDFEIEDPDVADCYGWLDLYGLTYEHGPDRQGVSDPVTVTTPINGMMHRYAANEARRETFFMDCSLARSLAKAAPHLRARDIIETVDWGVYNYRCIGGGEPPDCPNGISQHAYAKAIDIAGYITSDGELYSVNEDWVIDPSSQTTCTADTESEKDTFLHQVICELKGSRVWNIVLTPNYNDAHRNHFHVDLTTGSDYIRSGPLVDIGPDNH